MLCYVINLFKFFPLRFQNWQPKARFLEKHKVKTTKGNTFYLNQMPNILVVSWLPWLNVKGDLSSAV